MKMAAVILVNTPTIRNIPPMTSNTAIGRTNSGGSPRLPKKTLIDGDIFKLW
jgi:hypothetical protein